MLSDFNFAAGDLHSKHAAASHSVSGRHHAAVTAPSHRPPVPVSSANLRKPFQSWQLRRASPHRELPASFSQEEASDAQQLLQLGGRPHLTPTYSAALKLVQWTAHGSGANSSELQLLAAKTQQPMRQGCGPELTPTYGAALQSMQAKQQLALAAPAAAASGSLQTAGSSRGTAHISTKLHRAARSVHTACQDVRCGVRCLGAHGMCSPDVAGVSSHYTSLLLCLQATQPVTPSQVQRRVSICPM